MSVILEKSLNWSCSKVDACRVCASFWLTLLSVPLHAAATGDAAPYAGPSHFQLESNLNWLDISENPILEQDVLNRLDRGEFRPEQEFADRFIWQPSTVLLHARIEKQLPGPWLLHCEQVGLEQVDAFIKVAGGTAVKLPSVSKHTPHSSVSPGEGQTFMISLQAPLDLIIRIQTSISPSADFEILTPRALAKRRTHNRLGVALVLGAIALASGLLFFGGLVFGVRHFVWLSVGAMLYAVLLVFVEHPLALRIVPGLDMHPMVLCNLVLLLSLVAYLAFLRGQVRGSANGQSRNLLGVGSLTLIMAMGVVATLPPMLGTGCSIAVIALFTFGLGWWRVSTGSSPRELQLTCLHSLIALAVALGIVWRFSGFDSANPYLHSALWLTIVSGPLSWVFGASVYYRNLQSEQIGTQMESLELQHQLGEALESRLQIFSSIAHHLNNPLNYIVLGVSRSREEIISLQAKVDTLFAHAEDSAEATQIRQQFDGSFSKCAELFEDVQRGVQRASRVVDEMRGLTSLDGDVRELVLLEDLFSMCRSRVEDELGSKLTERVDVVENLGSNGRQTVYGNPYLILHALKNVVNNAYLFARRATSRRPTVEMELASSAPAGFVQIWIANNGPPIRVEDESHIFRLGYSSCGRRGTGLNVSQCILRENGGHIVLLDGGLKSGWVKFCVTLPIRDDGE